MRNISSLTMAIAIVFTLLWGNCAQCANVLPSPSSMHDCCGKPKSEMPGKCHMPSPAKQNCEGSGVDLAKVIAADAPSTAVDLAEAGPVPTLVALASDAVAGVVEFTSPPGDLLLLQSVFRI